jgi:hypothetical protein
VVPLLLLLPSSSAVALLLAGGAGRVVADEDRRAADREEQPRITRISTDNTRTVPVAKPPGLTTWHPHRLSVHCFY